jgi:ribosomal protein S12 methylthiotransferase accessory factor
MIDDAVLSDADVKTWFCGTHRCIPPADTLSRIVPLMPRFGITRVANVTGLDWIGLPVVSAYRPNSRSLAVAQGKGVTLEAAKVSALMEAIELHHAERVNIPLIYGRFSDLVTKHRIVEVAEMARTATGQYRDSLPLLWIEGFDLLQKERVLVPYESVHLDATYPQPSGSGCFVSSSNGLASGNSLLEAISHGICEVVERDATTLWSSRRTEARNERRVDLKTVNDPTCQDIFRLLDQAKMDLVVWDLTTDVEIPSFLAFLLERDQIPDRLQYSSAGMGCHPARDVALLRAVTEAVQSRLTLIAGARDDVFRDEYQKEVRRTERVLDHERLMKTGGARDFQDIQSFKRNTVRDDVVWALGQLDAAGIRRVVVVDLTDPSVNLPVVRVIIPGLEGPDKHPNYCAGARAKAASGN